MLILVLKVMPNKRSVYRMSAVRNVDLIFHSPRRQVRNGEISFMDLSDLRQESVPVRLYDQIVKFSSRFSAAIIPVSDIFNIECWCHVTCVGLYIFA